MTAAAFRPPSRRRSKRRAALWITSGALAAANIATFAAFTWGRLTESRRAEERAAEVARRLAESEMAFELVTARRATLEANARDMKIFDERVLRPIEEDLLVVQREVDGLVRAAGLRARTTAYGVEAVRGVDFVRCAIDMPLDGSYRSLVDLIRRIEAAERFLTVDSLTLSRGDGVARLQLRVIAYFRGEGLRARS